MQKENESISKSQAKRLQRQAELKKQKRNTKLLKVTGIIVSICLVVGLVAVIGNTIYSSATATKASNNYSALLDENGMIQNVDITSHITPIDPTQIKVPLSEIEYTSEELDTAINQKLEEFKIPQTDSALTIADQDTVNIDFVGTVDGVAFDGGNTNGAGYDLKIGSGSFIEGFEDQLIGAHPGDQLTVSVTFPEDYQTAELVGKNAEFAVTVNSLYTLPEFNDEFVATNLSDFATTAEGYKEYLKTTNYNSNLAKYLSDYIAKEASATTYPKEYVKVLKSLQKHDDETNYQNFNQMYYEATGSYIYKSFADYTGKSDKEYEKSLVTTAESKAAENMMYQALYTNANLSISDEEYAAAASKLGDAAENTYGKGYIMQQAIKEKVISHLAQTVTVA